MPESFDVIDLELLRRAIFSRTHNQLSNLGIVPVKKRDGTSKGLTYSIPAPVLNEIIKHPKGRGKLPDFINKEFIHIKQDQ